MALVIVEPRCHPLLAPVLYNAASFFGGGDACLYIFHGSHNASFVADIVNDWEGVQLMNLGIENLTISQYNETLTNPRFYEVFLSRCHDDAKLLVFQTDSLIFRPLPSKFITGDYDYVGAPWSWRHFHDEEHKDRVIGNGGFSLRKLSTMLRVCRENRLCDLPKGTPLAEDVFFSYHCTKFPSMEDAAEFSVEHIAHPRPFGHHQMYRFHPWERFLECMRA